MKNPFRNQFLAERTFRRWFINSFIIIFMFILSGVLLYLSALYVTKRVVQMAQEQSAEQTRELIDVNLYNLKKDISILTLNDLIISASYYKQPFTASNYYNYHIARKELTRIPSYQNIREIYVYYSQGDCFISRHNLIIDRENDFTQKRFGMTGSTWKTYAADQHVSSFLRIKDSIYFLCPLKINSSKKVTALAVVELDVDNIKQILPAGEENTAGGSYGYLVNSQGDLIATTGASTGILYGYGTLQPGENLIKNTVVICKKLEGADWEYISIVPISQYLKDIYILQYILYVYIAIIVLLASTIVYLETKRRYQPLQLLQNNIRAGGYYMATTELSKKQDIFSHLQEDIMFLVKDNTSMKSKIRKEKDILYGKQFSEIIGWHINTNEVGCFLEENFHMKYKQGVVVIANEIIIGSQLNGVSSEEKDNILLLCLNNIGTELFGEHYRCYFWRFVEITGLIWTDQEDASSYIYITNVLEQMRACIRQYFEVDFRMTISGPCLSPSSLSAAHIEAKATFDYANVTGKTGLIKYEESFTQLLSEWNNMDIIEAEQEFKNYMLEHNYRKAKSVLELIIGYYSYTDGTSIQLLTCRMFGLINLILNTLEIDKSSDEELFYINLNPVQRLLQATTIQRLETEIMDIIEALIMHYSEKDETTEKKLVYIDRYIEAHYMEHDLSVQQLADKFKLSYSFLSKIYKQQKGVGILEVINSCRISHAKELLTQEPGLSLTQVAERVGYSNVQTMLRIFKKIEKQTPGQYRARER